MTVKRKRFRFFLAALAVVVTFGGCSDTSSPEAASVRVVAVGDIAGCDTQGDEVVSSMLDTIPGPILALGDIVYLEGSIENYTACFHPSWGRHKPRILPSPGNHDYSAGTLAGYIAYFGDSFAPAGRAYYSRNIGAWHVISLDSEADVSAGSPQETWLRADLAANPARCTLAFFHRPRFTSGDHLSDPRMQPLWQALYDAGADLVLNGHEHDYQRFAPQTPAGQLDLARGLREFVVGTGGFSAENTFPGNQIANSEFRRGGVLGILKLTLSSRSYSWEFQSTTEGVIDQGAADCH